MIRKVEPYWMDKWIVEKNGMDYVLYQEPQEFIENVVTIASILAPIVQSVRAYRESRLVKQ